MALHDTRLAKHKSVDRTKITGQQPVDGPMSSADLGRFGSDGQRTGNGADFVR